MKNDYDNRTAITFLMIGLGIGAFLSLLMPAKQFKTAPARRPEKGLSDLGRMSA